MNARTITQTALTSFAIMLGVRATSWAAAPHGAEQVNLDQGSGSVEFHATGHPSALRIVGKGSAPKGSISILGKKATGTVHFELTSLDTGIEVRNRHMKEKYLEVGKYPESTLTITEMNLPNELNQDGSFNHVPFAGQLNLHGVAHPVTGTADITKSGDHVEIKADFGLRIADFAIALPSFAGITMADDVQIVVSSNAPISVQGKSDMN